MNNINLYYFVLDKKGTVLEDKPYFQEAEYIFEIKDLGLFCNNPFDDKIKEIDRSLTIKEMLKKFNDAKIPHEIIFLGTF